jgi:uncharacterized protein YcbK (DUF882 family)
MITKRITKNIWFHELVPVEFLKEKKYISDYDVRLLDIGLLSDIQKIRDHYNRPLIINDGKRFNWRGLRTKEYSGYNINSMHSWWRAYDFHIKDINVEEVRTHIKAEKGKYVHISAIEDKVNWIHVDSRFRPDGDLLVFDK